MQNSQSIIKYIAELYRLSDCRDPLARRVHLPHAYSTLNYARLLYGTQLPDSLAIASFAHDRDRIFEADFVKKSDFSPTLDGVRKYKQTTAHKGAKLLRKDLKGLLPAGMVDDITYLVEHHELGGERNNEILLDKPDSTKTYNLNYGADVLREADALSFFDFLPLYLQHRGKEETNVKMKYSFERLGSKGLTVLYQQHPNLASRLEYAQ